SRSGPLHCPRCSALPGHYSANCLLSPDRPWASGPWWSPPGPLPEELSIHPDCCEFPYTLLLDWFIGSSLNHSSHLPALTPVLFREFPVTGADAGGLPERERACTIRSAKPSPPPELNAPAVDSDANSPKPPVCSPSASS